MEDIFNVLLVDPDAFYREALKKVLVKEGVRVFESSSLSDAISQLSRTRIHLIITELVLGSFSGLSVFESLNKASPDSMLIVLTVYVELIPAEITEDIENVIFMKKPVGSRQITQFVASRADEKAPFQKDKMSGENPPSGRN